MQGVQVKLCYPLTMCAISERLRDASGGGAIQIDIYLYSKKKTFKQRAPLNEFNGFHPNK